MLQSKNPSMAMSSSSSRPEHEFLRLPSIIGRHRSGKKGIVVLSDVINELPMVVEDEDFSSPYSSLYNGYGLKNCSKSRIASSSLEAKLRDSGEGSRSEKRLRPENSGPFLALLERKSSESVSGEKSEKRSRAENGRFASSWEKKSREESKSDEGEFRARKFVFVCGGAKKEENKKEEKIENKKKDDDEKKMDEKEDMMVRSIADELAAVSSMNLRPKRPRSYRKLIETGGVLELRDYDESEKARTTECRKGGEKSEKTRKFCLTLSKEETTMDYIAIMGTKPPKKLKKRPRSVQNQLNKLYPCTEFGMITPELYEVHKKRRKR